MRIINGTVPGVSRLARLQVELSKKARQRLKWFDYYNSRSHNARLTCRHFDISPQTFYRWKGRIKRPYAIRKPKEYVARKPGDIVEVDTLDVRPLLGIILKHFTARDIISGWDVLEAHSRATSNTASGFIDVLLRRMPFPVKAIQVDGGSEFQDAFEEECRKRGIKLFVLPPRSPKLNGHVERAQRTHTEESYEVTDSSFELPELNQALLKWEKVYNTVRPHQALGYLTLLEFLEQYLGKENVSLII